MDAATQKRVPPNPWGARNPVHALVLAAATCAGLALCLALAVPFLPAFTWALTLAILFIPLHRRLEARVRHRNLAALLTVMIAALIVVLPLVFVLHQLIVQVASGFDVLGERLEAGGLEQALNSLPRISRAAFWLAGRVNFQETVQRAGAWVTEGGASFLKGSIEQLIQLTLTFYLMFYLVRDSRLALNSLRTLSPLSPGEMTRLLKRIADTIYATIFGTLMVAAVQGVLGGLMFWFLGLPGPLFWGLVMGLLAIVPVLGAFIVWIPAAALLLLNGLWWKALILAAWGVVVVGTADNLLGPILVGRRLQLHTVNIFVSLVGGLILFGTTGIVLGPLILAVTLALLDIWRLRTDDPEAA